MIELRAIGDRDQDGQHFFFGQHFFVPAYQRGYRWERSQVRDLLDDIFEFANKANKSKEEFYCLQPIVVRKYTWMRNGSKIDGWEVIDGQQRLTTIRILFEYLIKNYLKGTSFRERFNKDVFHISYETRENTEQFLKDIEAESDGKYIDEHYMSDAYQTISDWFKEKTDNGEMPDDIYDSFIKTLVYNKKNKSVEKGLVQVIWYEVDEDVDPVETFIRINVGKIPLTNSELVKALFLQKRNLSDNNNANDDLINLRQIEIANEWNNIENELHNEDFWHFLNPKQNEAPARIDFILDFMRNVALAADSSLEKKIGNDEYATFRYFYFVLFDQKKDYKAIKGVWEDIRKVFLSLKQWFDDPVWYHYAGFLIHCEVSIVTIYGAYNVLLEKSLNDTEMKKDDITKMFVDKIKSRFASLKWVSGKEAYLALSLSDKPKEKTKKIIRELLLLYSIEYIVRQCKEGQTLYKFPFKAFKETKDGKGWDIEHIDSYTTNDLNNYKDQKDWLSGANIALLRFGDDHKVLIADIDKYVKSGKADESFEELSGKIQKVFGEDANDEETKNGIGNLALLDAGTNRGYGNAVFPSKRAAILNKDAAGEFFPIGTKNVFLKYFDKTGFSTNTWNKEDIKMYRDAIAETLCKFLPGKEN